MPNRTLDPEQLENARSLLAYINERMEVLSGGDQELLFAYRRKVAKELQYGERSSPMVRRKLKAQKRKEQDNKCAECGEPLPEKYAVLDRFRAADGYTPENTQLLCEPCDRKIQTERRYA